MFTKENIFTAGEYVGFLKYMYDHGLIDLRGCPFVENIPQITEVVGTGSQNDGTQLVFVDEANGACISASRPCDVPQQDHELFPAAMEQARLCLLAYLN